MIKITESKLFFPLKKWYWFVFE